MRQTRISLTGAGHKSIDGCVVGIDPGLTGSIAIVDGRRVRAVLDMPNSARELARELFEYKPRFAYIEAQTAREGDSRRLRSISKLVQNYGWCIACLEIAGIPYKSVYPVSWKSTMKLMKQDKKMSIDYAKSLYPKAALSISKNHNRADAILIAHCAYLDLCKNDLQLGT